MLYVVLAAILILAVGLRWRFIQTVQLYPDEFVTLLAVQRITEIGRPILPSGLFYDHGLLFSYFGSLAAILGPARPAVRYASLIFGSLALLLTFWVGRKWFLPAVGLVATAGLAIAPAAIQWSGRARMYALLQLFVLLTLWLAYEGTVRKKASLRWLGLVAYLGATLTHFAAVTLAPPLVLGLLAVAWLDVSAERQDHVETRGTDGNRSGPRLNTTPPNSERSLRPWPIQQQVWLELAALVGILIISFLVKRAGQPQGIEALDGSAGQALNGLVQVFNIYSDFAFNFNEGWQAIAPFFLSLPALLFLPFVLIIVLLSLAVLFRSIFRHDEADRPTLAKQENLYFFPVRERLPAIFLSIILVVTTLEMVLLVSPDRRDDKYQFMLFPVLLVLGAAGLSIVANWVAVVVSRRSILAPRHRSGNNAVSATKLQSRLVALGLVAVTTVVLVVTWSNVRDLLADTGDDYDSAFAFVRERWQSEDAILTGTPSAAAFYLGRSDFYSVQRRGGYDYRILTVDDRAVDRWLASPAIRTEADLHQALSNYNVWLVLERWGLQREYYEPLFQQQLLAQTDYVAETQGIFILRSRSNPRPIQPEPAGATEAVFGDLIQLDGYTVEPAEPGPGQSVRVTLYWQALASILPDYTVFIHLRQPDGSTVAQADHRPLGNLFPMSLWPVGQTIRETSELALPADLPPGDYCGPASICWKRASGCG
jgi:hypothetical protein